MKNVSMVLGGILLGAALMVFVTTRQAVAPWYSLAIYDCGIRVAKGATGGTLSGFMIVGHYHGYCQDESTSEVSLDGIRFN